MTYTSGPWISRQHGNLWFILEAEASVAEVWDPDNARLMAAAPDLLLAIKAVRGLDNGTDILAGNEHIREQVRTAIAKAEGRVATEAVK